MSETLRTPPPIATYMANLLPPDAWLVLVPTPSARNILHAISGCNNRHELEYAHGSYWHLSHTEENYPAVILDLLMMESEEMERYLDDARQRCTDTIIAWLPFNYFLSARNKGDWMEGFKAVSVTTLLGRNELLGAYINYCIVKLKKGYTGTETIDHLKVTQ